MNQNRSRGCSINIVIRLQAGRPWFNSRQRHEWSSSPPRQELHWGPHSLLPSRCGGGGFLPRR